MLDKTFTNPILPGFYPDPSICRVGDDFYLVTSTFAYFPGVPIFHSRDLVQWDLIGHVLDRPSQLDLDGVGTSQGIFAPTIRYHEGTFYMVTTNVHKGGNFYVTATDPRGPWSDPVWLPQAPGIDPTIFFDVDGSAWYLGTRPAPEGPAYNGNWEVWIQPLDVKRGVLTGEPRALWRGALRDAIWPEGPHLYFRDGSYYLMIAEGGTGPDHAVTMARSSTLLGPYVGNPRNPILTHRHLGSGAEVTNVGHADLVETSAGEWWMICLASRPYGGPFRNLGRETFLVPCVWEDGWLVVAPGVGKILDRLPRPQLPMTVPRARPSCDAFDAPALEGSWVFLRTPREEFWSLSDRPGWLTLKVRPVSLTEKANPSAVFRRQQHFSFWAATLLDFDPKTGEQAGLVVRQNEEFQIFVAKALDQGREVVRLERIVRGEVTVLASVPVPPGPLRLAVEARGQSLAFRWASAGEEKTLVDNIDARFLSTDVAGGFVGTLIGLFATGPEATNQRAHFDWFEYHEIPR